MSSASACSRRAVFAARFLRPPGYIKRAIMREKPRDWTGAFENPGRRWVRLREKAKQFCQLPPPRKVPVPKFTTSTTSSSSSSASGSAILRDVEHVPDVADEVLERRLQFLLGDQAIQEQLHAPMVAGATPYAVESRVWERQMVELRRIYRAQYLRKLSQVTKTERAKEEELQDSERRQRRKRKLELLKKQCEDRKRRAILKDRLRVDSKVNQMFQMQRRSKLKLRRLSWVDRLAQASEKNVVDKLTPGAGGRPRPRRGNYDLRGCSPSFARMNENNVAEGEKDEEGHAEDQGDDLATRNNSTTSTPSSGKNRSKSSALGDNRAALSKSKTDLISTQHLGQPANPLPKASTSFAIQPRPDFQHLVNQEETNEQLFDRDVSVPHLMRQVGQATEFPRQKSRRIPEKKNLFREIQEQSYEVLPEDHFTKQDADRLEAFAVPEIFPGMSSATSSTASMTFMARKKMNYRKEEQPVSASTSGVLNSTEQEHDGHHQLKDHHRARAEMEYENFSVSEKKQMLDEKIKMLNESLERREHLAEMPGQMQMERVLLDQLLATRVAMDEAGVVAEQEGKLKMEQESRRKDAKKMKDVALAADGDATAFASSVGEETEAG
ncbi:unnamed protein product [Amoebophrya sp. A120]|nr:unnamed protein product [Amoebophrya sp. A120]|eukprot:GSA120T00015621001.1